MGQGYSKTSSTSDDPEDNQIIRKEEEKARDVEKAMKKRDEEISTLNDHYNRESELIHERFQLRLEEISMI